MFCSPNTRLDRCCARCSDSKEQHVSRLETKAMKSEQQFEFKCSFCLLKMMKNC